MDELKFSGDKKFDRGKTTTKNIPKKTLAKNDLKLYKKYNA